MEQADEILADARWISVSTLAVGPSPTSPRGSAHAARSRRSNTRRDAAGFWRPVMGMADRLRRGVPGLDRAQPLAFAPFSIRRGVARMSTAPVAASAREAHIRSLPRRLSIATGIAHRGCLGTRRAAQPRAVTSPAPPRGGPSRAGILIANDEPAIVMAVQDELAFEGFEAHAAASGPEALEMARTVRPDVLLLDLMLPEINGFDVCRTLRPERPDLSIIMLTVRGQRSQSRHRIRGGRRRLRH